MSPLAEAPAYLLRMNQEIERFLSSVSANRDIVDFVAMMRAWGVEGADGMTPQEAAGEFLRRAAQFSELLSAWKRSPELGWDLKEASGLNAEFPGRIQSLLGVIAQAHMRTGNGSEAMDAWSAMRRGFERFRDPPLTWHREALRRELSETLRAGLALGAWDEAGLRQIGASVPQDDWLRVEARWLQSQRAWLTDSYMSYSPFITGPPAQSGIQAHFDLLRPVLDAVLISNQQRADNVALFQHAMDHALDRFDPATGWLRPAASGENQTEFLAALSDSWIDRKYFYLAKYANGVAREATDNVIRAHAEADFMRLAVALQGHRLRSGEYPERLDAVAADFPKGLPLDPATGASYHYAREDDGGFKLWGLGLDQTNEQGHFFKDVMWWQPPPEP